MEEITPKKRSEYMALYKDVKGYEGLYLISDEGEVISLKHDKPKRLKTGLRGRDGLFYEFVSLAKNGENKCFSVHRLVAEAFLDNPNNFPEVNHKDENPLNNCVDNLEWCTRQYNIDYSKSKRVEQFENGEKIAEYKSIAEASRQTGIKRTAINNNLTGWSETAGGYTWKYTD